MAGEAFLAGNRTFKRARGSKNLASVSIWPEQSEGGWEEGSQGGGLKGRRAFHIQQMLVFSLQHFKVDAAAIPFFADMEKSSEKLGN